MLLQLLLLVEGIEGIVQTGFDMTCGTLSRIRDITFRESHLEERLDPVWCLPPRLGLAKSSFILIVDLIVSSEVLLAFDDIIVLDGLNRMVKTLISEDGLNVFLYK